MYYTLPIITFSDVLEQPRAAEWFRKWWTGPRGRRTLAHAGHAGSNNNMRVEVDWRDMKQSVSKLTFMDPPIGPETQPQQKPVKSGAAKLVIPPPVSPPSSPSSHSLEETAVSLTDQLFLNK
jgi:hypothetical protein